MSEPGPEPVQISLAQLYDEMIAAIPDDAFDVEAGLTDLHRRIEATDE